MSLSPPDKLFSWGSHQGEWSGYATSESRLSCQWLRMNLKVRIGMSNKYFSLYTETYVIIWIYILLNSKVLYKLLFPPDAKAKESG